MDKFYRSWLLLSIACASEDAAVMLQMGKVAPLAVAPLSLVQGSIVVPSGGCSKAAAAKKVVRNNVFRRCSSDTCTSVMATGGHCYRQRTHAWWCQGKWYVDKYSWFRWPGDGCKYIAPKEFNKFHPLWTASLPNQGWCKSAEDKFGGYCRAPKGIFETPDDCFNYVYRQPWSLKGTVAVQFRGGVCDFYRLKGEAPNDCPKGFRAGKGTDTKKRYKKLKTNPSWAVFCRIFR